MQIDIQHIFSEALGHHQAGRLTDAERLYRQILSLDARHADALHLLGVIAHQVGQNDIAVQLINQAIALDHTVAAYHSNLGIALKHQGQFDAAVGAYNTAIRLKPDYAEAHFNLGSALQEQGQLDEAMLAYKTAIGLKPDYAEAHSNLGTILKEQGHLEEAICAYKTAIRYKPDFAEAHSNLGNSLQQQGNLDAAMNAYNTAIRLKPDYAEALYNLSLLFLKIGYYITGFRLWEMRKRAVKPAGLRHLPNTETLDPGVMAGQRILIHWEQGLGDTIQFCRYVPQVAGRAASVSFAVPPELKAILRDAFPSVRVITDDEIASDYDAHCPLLSLPLAFSTTLKTIPAPSPYLSAPRHKSAAWAARLGVKRRPRVGLVWHGGTRAKQRTTWSVNKRRNIDFAIIAGLHMDGIDFYSLQKGEPAEGALKEELPRHWTNDNFYNLASELHDFTDTAALIEHLDLVISVDTSTAHLAGAMGKPVWILNRFDACWRWLDGRTDTPWYPTARLFRQPEPGAWTPVIAAVRAELKTLLA